jgi:hypothetical protein
MKFINIMSSLGLKSPYGKESIRDVIMRFLDEMPPSNINKLVDILKSHQKSDEFLLGIRETRK